MGFTTLIEWCDSTVNPTTGCDGCELWHVRDKGPCYAGSIHERRLAKSLPNLYAPSFTDVRLAPGRMAAAAKWSDLRGKPRAGKPWLSGHPRTIFVGDMGDVFSKDVPDQYLRDEIVGTAQSELGRRHNWLLLTKQVRRAAAFIRSIGGAWPRNLWLGVSITTAATIDRELVLADQHAVSVKFLSIEPILRPLSLSADVLRAIDWVIVGGESGPNARPCDVEWVRRIVRQCQVDGVPVFVKQLGSNPQGIKPLRHKTGSNPDEWPEDLRVWEFPGGGDR